MKPPSPSVFLANAVPTALGIDAIMTLAPQHHALYVAAHAWRHGPLGYLLHLVDLAMTTEDQDREHLDQVANTWGRVLSGELARAH